MSTAQKIVAAQGTPSALDMNRRRLRVAGSAVSSISSLQREVTKRGAAGVAAAAAAGLAAAAAAKAAVSAERAGLLAVRVGVQSARDGARAIARAAAADAQFAAFQAARVARAAGRIRTGALLRPSSLGALTRLAPLSSSRAAGSSTEADLAGRRPSFHPPGGRGVPPPAPKPTQHSAWAFLRQLHSGLQQQQRQRKLMKTRAVSKQKKKAAPTFSPASLRMAEAARANYERSQQASAKHDAMVRKLRDED
jgi:hypothetical protein